MILTICGMDNDTAAIILPIVTSILIFLGGGLAKVLSDNVKRRKDIKSARDVVFRWSGMTIDATNKQISSLAGLSKTIHETTELLPKAFPFSRNIGDCNPITGSGESKDFAPINHWKPSELADYIIMLILSEPEEKLGFSWNNLEKMSDDEQKAAVSTIIRRIEGYANSGFDYIQNKFESAKEEFRSPYVFMNLLRDVVAKEKERLQETITE